MADGTAPTAGKTPLTIPADIQKKYPELIELIKASESMNDEERQYWINILPIMTPDQTKNLHDILDNEKKQLAAIDMKYQNEIDHLSQAETSNMTDADRKQKRDERKTQEATHKRQEDQEAENLLKQIDDLGKAT